MDVVSYSFTQDEIDELTKLMEKFVKNVYLDVAVLCDDGGRLITYAPQVENLKPLSMRSAVISAAVNGALEYLEGFVDKANTLYVAGNKRSVYMLKSEYSFILFCSFHNGTPVGSVKLFSEKLLKEISPILEKAKGRGKQPLTIRFEDIAI